MRFEFWHALPGNLLYMADAVQGQLNSTLVSFVYLGGKCSNDGGSGILAHWHRLASLSLILAASRRRCGVGDSGKSRNINIHKLMVQRRCDSERVVRVMLELEV